MFLKTCWYVAAWDDDISRSLHRSLIEGDLEDKHLIEAQQVGMA